MFFDDVHSGEVCGKMSRSQRRFAGSGGFTLLETLAVLAIAAILFAGLTSLVNTSYSNARAQQAALYQSQLSTAAAQLIQDNYSALLPLLSAGAPQVIPLSSPNSAGFKLGTYLPATIQARNAYQQTPCLLVYRGSGAGWSGVTGGLKDIEAFLVTEGGQAIDDRTLGNIEASAGPGAGAIQSMGKGVAQGAFGSWSAPLTTINPANSSCSGNATGTGHLVSQIYYTGSSGASGDFLYRQPTSVTGVADGNTMHAPIVLYDGGATNVHRDRTPDSDCNDAAGSPVGLGKISADSAGNVLGCMTTAAGTMWTVQGSMHWRDAVANFAALPASSAVAPPQVGDVAVTSDTGRAFAYTTNGWKPLAVDENGNLTVPGWLNLGFQLDGGPCTPDPNQSGTRLATDVSGLVLACKYDNQSGAYVWQPQSMQTGVSYKGCIWLQSPSPGASDYPGCAPAQGGYATSNYQLTVWYTYHFTVTRPTLASVSSWGHMDIGICGSKPGRVGQLFQALYITDSNNNQVAYSEAETPNLVDDRAGITNAASRLLTVPGTYQVTIQNTWWTYANFQSPWNSSACDANGNTIPTTPLLFGYMINTVYEQ